MVLLRSGVCALQVTLFGNFNLSREFFYFQDTSCRAMNQGGGRIDAALELLRAAVAASQQPLVQQQGPTSEAMTSTSRSTTPLGHRKPPPPPPPGAAVTASDVNHYHNGLTTSATITGLRSDSPMVNGNISINSCQQQQPPALPPRSHQAAATEHLPLPPSR